MSLGNFTISHCCVGRATFLQRHFFLFCFIFFFFPYIKMSNVLKKPVRRKKLKQRERETSGGEQENNFNDDFQQIKKKRTERKENAKTLNMVNFVVQLQIESLTCF